jgi:hypothetical protein
VIILVAVIIIIIIIIIIILISHLSALAGKYSPILGCIINRIRLGSLMCNLGNFLQLNMCQELPLSAFLYVFGCRLSLFRLCDSDFGP